MISLVAQWQRTCLPMQGTWVQSLNQEDPLEKEMATHSSILAWKIQQRSLAGYSPQAAESDATERLYNTGFDIQLEEVLQNARAR